MRDAGLHPYFVPLQCLLSRTAFSFDGTSQELRWIKNSREIAQPARLLITTIFLVGDHLQNNHNFRSLTRHREAYQIRACVSKEQLRRCETVYYVADPRLINARKAQLRTSWGEISHKKYTSKLLFTSRQLAVYGSQSIFKRLSNVIRLLQGGAEMESSDLLTWEMDSAGYLDLR